jgi:hypothetical protein
MYAAALLGITHLTKKKESVLEPFKRTVQLADEEQKKALNELEDAVSELSKVMEEKSK